MTLRDETTRMKQECKDSAGIADEWLSESLTEPTRVYWLLVKQASELWLEQNAKKKRPAKKRALS